MARPAAPAVALLVAALAAVWAVAAWWLWQTSVPGGLRLPGVEAADVLPEPALDEARDFERFLRWSYVASAVVLLGAFAVYARYGMRFARESAAGRIGTGMLLGMLGSPSSGSSRSPSGSSISGGSDGTTSPSSGTSTGSCSTGLRSAVSSFSSVSRS